MPPCSMLATAFSARSRLCAQQNGQASHHVADAPSYTETLPPSGVEQSKIILSYKSRVHHKVSRALLIGTECVRADDRRGSVRRHDQHLYLLGVSQELPGLYAC